LVLIDKLKVSENILKANRLDYLISKAKMETNLESIPPEALSNILAASDYDSIISLERSSKKLRENIRNVVTSGMLLDKLLKKYGLTKQELQLPNELIENLTYNDVKRLENNEAFQLILLQKLQNWLMRNDDYYDVHNEYDDLNELRILEQLNLSNQSLETLPESIGILHNLINLNLEDNELETLPESIGNLSNLRILNLNDNELETLPESIGILRNLKKLYLEDNELETLPEFIGNLSNLTHLYLIRNELKTLPESIGNLSNLTHLYLQENKLTHTEKQKLETNFIKKYSYGGDNDMYVYIKKDDTD
jgi:Leucine-rich repeat (LRR) protein